MYTDGVTEAVRANPGIFTRHAAFRLSCAMCTRCPSSALHARSCRMSVRLPPIRTRRTIFPCWPSAGSALPIQKLKILQPPAAKEPLTRSLNSEPQPPNHGRQKTRSLAAEALRPRYQRPASTTRSRCFSSRTTSSGSPSKCSRNSTASKRRSRTRGANAREVHRRLSERFRTTEQMKEGVRLENGGRLHVCVNPSSSSTITAGTCSQRIAALRGTAHALPGPDVDRQPHPRQRRLPRRHASDRTILVTKDSTCSSRRAPSGSRRRITAPIAWRTATSAARSAAARRRNTRRSIFPATRCRPLPARSSIELPQCCAHFLPNQYVLLRNEEEHTTASPRGISATANFGKLRHDHITIRGGRTLTAANLGQRFFLDALYDPEISLITVYGKAGTGKTLLSVGAALEQVQSGEYEKMLITRVIMPTGRDIGFLPGRMEEKMQPWVQPAYDALEQLLATPAQAGALREEEAEPAQSRPASRPSIADRGPATVQPAGQSRAGPGNRSWQAGLLEIEAIAHIRGRSIPRAVFIVDEAQQLTPHEAKTLVTRMGKGSKIILIGDLAQIDNPYVDAHTNGLVLHPQPPARPALHGPREPLQRRAQRDGRGRGEPDIVGVERDPLAACSYRRIDRRRRICARPGILDHRYHELPVGTSAFLTRRQFFSRSATGLGVAALSSLLERDLGAVVPGKDEGARMKRIGGLPACRTSRRRRSASSTCSRTARRRTSTCSTTSRSWRSGAARKSRSRSTRTSASPR